MKKRLLSWKNLESTEPPMFPSSKKEKLIHLVPDFDEPNQETRHHALVQLGGVNFQPSWQSLHCPLHRPSTLLENEVFGSGLVPETYEANPPNRFDRQGLNCTLDSTVCSLTKQDLLVQYGGCTCSNASCKSKFENKSISCFWIENLKIYYLVKRVT